jgi:HEAT repeat protein
VEANELLLSALRAEDPRLQAIAVQGLRERGIPGAMHKLIDLVDSPHAAVREVVRECLSEFHFARFRETFEMLDDEARRSAGSLVKRVDPEAIPELLKELQAPSRSRRLRGVEMVAAMDAVAEFEPQLLELLRDEDQFVRAETVRALANHNSPQTRQALRELLIDSRDVVREAAENVLQALAAGRLAGNEDSPAVGSTLETTPGPR